MRRNRRVVTIAATVGLGLTSLGLPSPAMAGPTSQPAAAASLSDKAAAQIAALQKIKTSLTPAEQKLDSRLSVELRKRRDKTATPLATTGVVVSRTGMTMVDVRATSVGKDLLARLRGVGGTVRYASVRTGSVRVELPLSVLPTVASWPAVTRVEVATGAMTARETGPGVLPGQSESKQARMARVDAELRAALAHPGAAQPGNAQPRAAQPVGAGQGTVVSEGDKAHAADAARTQTKVTGIGVKVCVLSDGVDSLAAAEASGELPYVDVLPGQAGSGDEGTAMLEIVHDLAPGATLGFATAFISDASFADNIRALRTQAHCAIIVDDVSYFNEDPFQDGPIAQAVNAVTADGALYFSSAGNEGNTLDGTAGNDEGDFVNSGQGVGKFIGSAHDFDPGPGVQVFEPLSDRSSAGVPVTLFWADPLGHAADDYDLYLFDSTDTVVGFSQNVQNGSQDPFEILQTPAFGSSGLRLAVVKFAGADRYFQLTALRGRFADSADGLKAYVTPGETRGHSAAAAAFSVAAAPAKDPLPFDLEPGDPPNPSGPYPNPFTAAQRPERFTSDGPRRVFFTADGSPITPGNFSSTGGAVRQKPDITAADGVSTSVPGFAPFFGTSAAAPHAAAIAALVLSGNPGTGEADLRDAFDATALDLAPSGVDARSGYGIIRADDVLDYTGATPQPLVQAGSPTVTPTTGDGDPYLEPGETGTVSLPAVNVGDGTATGVSVVVSTADPGATLRPRSRSYGTIEPGATKSAGFTLALAAGYPVGKPVPLTVRVSFAGVLSPTTSTVSVPTGQPASTAQTFAYHGAPVPIPDVDPAGASVRIPVSGVGYAADLTFSIDGQTCTTDAGSTTVGLDHTFVSDLFGTLTGPDGRTAILFQRSGGSGHNLCHVVFDDAASQPFSSVTTDQAPFTGRWRPIDPLSSFRTAPVDGTWTFSVVDQAPGDTGSIRAVSLHITGYALRRS